MFRVSLRDKIIIIRINVNVRITIGILHAFDIRTRTSAFYPWSLAASTEVTEP